MVYFIFYPSCETGERILLSIFKILANFPIWYLNYQFYCLMCLVLGQWDAHSHLFNLISRITAFICHENNCLDYMVDFRLDEYLQCSHSISKSIFQTSSLSVCCGDFSLDFEVIVKYDFLLKVNGRRPFKPLKM